MTQERMALVVKGSVFASGGVESSAQRIARALTAAGPFAVDVLMLRPELGRAPGESFYDATPARVRDGVRYFELPCLTSFANPSERAFTAHLALLAHIRREKYRLLHGLYASKAGFHAAYAAAECGIPCVVGLRGNDIHADVFQEGGFARLQWALGHADRVTSLTTEALRRADLLTGCGKRGHVILNSIDPAVYREGREQLVPEDHAGPVIGSLAKFRAKKAAGALLAAFQLLTKDVPDARLVLAGEIDKDAEPEIREAVAALGIADQVTLTGTIPREDAVRHIRGMDVFVHPALHDACPNAILEAMVAGTPIVASAVGAIPEVITDGCEGRLVAPAGCPHALRDAMLEVLRQPATAAGYVARAAEAVRTRFAPDREVRELHAVYESCLSASGNPVSARTWG